MAGNESGDWLGSLEAHKLRHLLGARTLDLAVSTIKVHLAALYRTFGAHNRVEALCRAGCLPAMAYAR